MHFNSPEPGEKQQNDGRLTIIILFVLLLLIWNYRHDIGFTKHVIIQKNRFLSSASDKSLYITDGAQIIQPPESPALIFYPILFLPLPINSSEKDLLMTIKGIGPALAESIIVHRQKVGPILNIRDLQAIPGIGSKRAASLATEMVFDTAE